MANYSFTLEKVRFALNEENVIYFSGWYRDDNPDGRLLRVYLGHMEMQVDYNINTGKVVRRTYVNRHANVGEEIIGCIRLPENWETTSGLRFTEYYQGKESTLCRRSVKDLQRYGRELPYDIESETWEIGKVFIKGWALPQKDSTFHLYKGKEEVPCTVERFYKKEVLEAFPDADIEDQAGFDVVADMPERTDLTLVIQAGQRKVSYSVAVGKNSKIKKVAQKGTRYLQENGVNATWERGLIWMEKQKHVKRYEAWRQNSIITEEEAERQRQQSKAFAYQPKFSIVVPLYNTQHDLLREMIDSCLNQTYGNLELCMADGTGPDSSLIPILEEYVAKDSRVVYKTLLENKGISENTNAALELATGDYIVLVDHDDTIVPEALYECARVLNEHPDVNVIYSDEDKMDETGQIFFEPHLKSDFNQEMLRSMNYICHLFVAEKELMDRVGHFSREYDGSQDFDMILRCCEGARGIYHIPKVLYHWRCNINSTAAHPEQKMWAYEAGKRAIRDHYKRQGIEVTVDNTSFGRYKSTFQRTMEHKISVIVAGGNNTDDTLRGIKNMLETTSYTNLEVLLVTPQEISEVLLTDLQEQHVTHDDHSADVCDISIRQVSCDASDGYYARCQRGAAEATGEYLLFKKDDVELIEADAIEELLDYATLPDIGAVGTRISCKNEQIWNCGYVLNMKGAAGNAFMGALRFDPGYFCRAESLQNMSAVSGWFLMVSRGNFDAVGGFAEGYGDHFADVDLCLKLQQQGLRNVMNPFAEVYYVGEKSPDRFKKIERSGAYKADEQKFVASWTEVLAQDDPYYNVNLALDSTEFYPGR